jgi:hypothetical protein
MSYRERERDGQTLLLSVRGRARERWDFKYPYISSDKVIRERPNAVSIEQMD